MKLWGGRFSKECDAGFRRFGDSIGFDVRLYAADVRGSIAYASALARSGIIDGEEHRALTDGLLMILGEFERGGFEVKPDDEDIHSAVERRLTELIGAPAGKLHTGRSRNDQVTTDLRLYVLDQIPILRSALQDLQCVIVDKSEEHVSLIIPGYTHLQPAQPVLFSHWLMSFFWKLQRDLGRLSDLTKRIDVCPLGSGALAGNAFGLDRQALAADLGFSRATENSMDAVADRDYVVELIGWAALVQSHLSRLAEDLILWASREFGFVQLDEAYSTGSSIMPQKRNPDSLELIRGKSGRIIGHLAAVLTTLKGLPSTYNKDLQEDKEALFDTVDTLLLELPVMTGVIGTIVVFDDRVAAANSQEMLATDLAEYLVRRGVPFRQSHRLVGELVKLAEARGTRLSDLDLADYRSVHPSFSADVHETFDFKRSVSLRKSHGGTAPEAVLLQLERARAVLRAASSQADDQSVH
jgi:argininosuccinate lyase